MASLTVVSLFVVRIEGLFVREECIGEEGKAGREKVRNDLVWLEGLVGLAGSGWWTCKYLLLLVLILAPRTSES